MSEKDTRRRIEHESEYQDVDADDFEIEEHDPATQLLNTSYNSSHEKDSPNSLRRREGPASRALRHSDEHASPPHQRHRRRLFSTSTCLYALLSLFSLLGLVNLAFLAFGITVLNPSISFPFFSSSSLTSASDFLPGWGESGHLGEGLKHYPTDLTRDITPIPAHSHNDYWRRVPLFEALHYGLTGVEADVWLQPDGELLVGHDEASLTRNRTFRSLYVDPIVEILERMNPEDASTDSSNPSGDAKRTKNGPFDTDRSQPLILLVDLKTDGYATLPAVQAQLSALREKGWLTYYDASSTEENHVVHGPVQVVMTGNTPFDLLVANETYRDVFFDAPLDRIWADSEAREVAIREGRVKREDGMRAHSRLQRREAASGQGVTGTEGITGASFTPENSFYASCSMRDVLGWGPHFGRLTDRHLEIIRGQIKAAQKQGLKVRYWETPNWPVGIRNHVWATLWNEGVDYLNVDDLKSAAKGDWKAGEQWRFWR